MKTYINSMDWNFKFDDETGEIVLLVFNFFACHIQNSSFFMKNKIKKKKKKKNN